MSITVETGEGLPNSDSYVSVADATAYHAKFGNVSWARTERATGSLTLRAQPSVNDTIKVGAQTYRFVSSLTTANDVLIGGSTAETASNTAAAINYSGAPGVAYHANTAFNEDVEASSDSSGQFASVTFTAREPGPTSIDLEESVTNPNVTVTGNIELVSDEFETALVRATRYLDDKYGQRWLGSRTNEDQALDWPRLGVEDPDGRWLDDDIVPQAVKDACCEAALELLVRGDLSPSVSPDDSGAVQSESASVGPLSFSQSFSGAKSTEVSIPKVSRVLSGLTVSTDRIYRG